MNTMIRHFTFLFWMIVLIKLAKPQYWLVLLVLWLQASIKMSQYQNNKAHGNYHMRRGEKAVLSEPKVHILCRTRLSHRMKALKEELTTNQIVYTVREDPGELVESADSPQRMVIIVFKEQNGNPEYQASVEKQLLALKNNESIKIVSFPLPCKTLKTEHFSKERDLLDYCQAYLSSAQGRRIKLSSVHSIKGSKDKRQKLSKSPKSHFFIGGSYEKLFYQASVYNDYDNKASALPYEAVLEHLELMPNSISFTYLKELEDSEIFREKKKYLLLMTTSEKSRQLIESITKKKARNIEIILLGEMNPSSALLLENVVLATNDSRQIVDYLEKSGFAVPNIEKLRRRNSIDRHSISSSGFKANMLNLMRESSQASSHNILNNFEPGTPKKEKQVHHWIVDKTNDGQFSTREVSGGVGSFQELGRVQLDASEEESEDKGPVIDKIIASEIISSDRSDPNIRQTVNSIQKEISEGHRPPESGQQPRFYRHYPSNIIQEVSEEYRGSVKESIMNLDPEMSNRSTRQLFPSHLYYNEGTHDQKKNTISPVYESLNYRAESEKRATPNINIPNQIASSGIAQSRLLNVAQQNPPRQIEYNGGSYQSPSKVLKKEVTSPEEVKQMDQKGVYRLAYPQASSNTPIHSTRVEITPSNSSQSIPPSPQYVNYNTFRAINANRVSEVIQTPTLSRQTYASPIDQLRNLGGSNANDKEVRGTNSTAGGINLDDYQKIETNGRVVYRKRVKADESTTAPKNIGQLPYNAVYYTSLSPRQTMAPSNSLPSEKIEQMASDPHQELTLQSVIKQNPISKPQEQPSKREVKALPSPPAKRQLHMKQSPQAPSITISMASSRKQAPKFGQLHTNSNGRSERLEPRAEGKGSGGKPNNLLNESNMFSRMSQLHSDGSILRRNNIRFGVKRPEPKRERVEVSMLESKLVSGIYKGNNLNKKGALSVAVCGDEEMGYERRRLLHVITKFNSFHFIIQEDLAYLKDIIGGYVAGKNDRIEVYSGVEQLCECIRTEKVEDRYDVGFIFASRQEIRLINTNIFPDDYYVVLIEAAEEQMLEIDEAARRIRMNQLRCIFLAQKIIIDSKLYQYVAYRNNKREIELLADKFMNTEFILEKVETEFTSEIIDFYYCELPRLTRLYLLCDEFELAQLLKLLSIYEEFNPNFSRESCKLICLIGDILKNDELIMSHPTVTFISNPEEIKSYDNILKYAHHLEEDSSHALPIDQVFVHQKHLELDKKLNEVFPGRFSIVLFGKLSEVYLKMERMAKVGAKFRAKQKSYLILHEGLTHEKISVDRFTKVFMIGKAKAMQSQVIRVINYEELFEMLKN